MARSIQTIQSELDATQATKTELTTLNSTSQTAIYTLWKYVFAVSSNLLEQLWDLFKVDLEDKISKAAVGSNKWLQDRVLKFQYSATVPQVLEVGTDYSVNYTTIDESLRIITRASVKTTDVRTVTIKVAKEEPPIALSAGELSSLQGYVDDISFAGVQTIVTSTAADKLYLEGSIYYAGQYASVISDNVIAAINTYLAAIPFDGSISLLGLTDAIQSVTGVTDILLNNVAVRADATAFASKTYMIQSNTTIITNYPTNAGYVVEETTSGQTFTDKLTFVAQ